MQTSAPSFKEELAVPCRLALNFAHSMKAEAFVMTYIGPCLFIIRKKKKQSNG